MQIRLIQLTTLKSQLLRWVTVSKQSGPKSGKWAATPLSVGELGPHLHNVALAEAYLHAKWHLDPSRSLATLHQRYRQEGNGPMA